MGKYTSYHVQHLTNKPNKPWQARLKYKDEKTGKWKEKTKILKGATGKKDAKKLAEEWFDEMNEASSLSPNYDTSKTIGEMVLEYLDYQLRTGEIEKSTHHNQKVIYNSFARDYIGDYGFLSIDKDVIDIWLAKLNNKGLAQGSIYAGYCLVKKVYEYYYQLGYLTRNPFMGVKAPKASGIRTTHLEPEQRKRFLECVEYEKPNRRIAYLLAYYTGMRRGELCGLRWRAVRFDTGEITVETAIGVGDNSYAKQPKSRSSIRTFPMVPQLIEILKEYKGDSKEEDFVIGRGTHFLAPATLGNNFREFAIKYDLKDAYGNRLTLHGLRHNLGAMGIQSQMDIASLSKMLGHSSRAMTLDVYGDAMNDAMKVATKKLGEEFDK